MCRTILCINICKRVGSYLDLTIKFHDYSSFFTAFDVANRSAGVYKCKDVQGYKCLGVQMHRCTNI